MRAAWLTWVVVSRIGLGIDGSLPCCGVIERGKRKKKMCVLSSGFLVFSFFIYLWLKFGLVQVSESKRIKEVLRACMRSCVWILILSCMAFEFVKENSSCGSMNNWI